MFVASTVAEVWRTTRYEGEYSEYSTEPTSETNLIYKKMPIHITPFRPSYSNSSTEAWQSTIIQGNIRKNYVVFRGDEVRTSDGRSFTVEAIESTDGIFMKNQRVLYLTEVSPTVS